METRRTNRMRHGCIVGCLLLLLPAMGPCRVITTVPLVVDSAFANEVRDHIQSHFNHDGQATTVANTPLSSPGLLRTFYGQRRYEPVWSDITGLSPQVEAFLNLLRDAPHEGLNSEDYHIHIIDTFLTRLRHNSTRELTDDALVSKAALDLLLSDAFFTYAAHMSSGQNPPTPVYHADPAKSSMEQVHMLQDALKTDSILTTLSKLRPSHRAYAMLRQALNRYRRIAAQGGWPILPEGPTLYPGDRGLSIMLLWIRLQATGDLESTTTQDRTVFDDTLASAVRRFQRRHGLVEDGIVGPDTRTALQVPIEDRIHQLTRNLDRWRWLPRDLGPRYIWVNIPAFTLEVVDHNETVITMRVVLGKPSWPTPVLRGWLSSLVFNPHWHVPPGIAQQEIIPHLRRDPAYLMTHNITLLRGHGDQAIEIAPDTVDWARTPWQGIPYQFRQEPGPTNPLGRVKFIMPNPFQITLHDTPSRELFAMTVRAQSHGCIRLEKPILLAEYLLREDLQWTRPTILDAIEQSIPRQVRLPSSIPVYLIYHTAWADQDGRVHFRPDIYRWDSAFSPTLDERQPAACG